MITRRQFLRRSAVLAVATVLPAQLEAQAENWPANVGVPLPPEGEQWYLGLATGQWAGRCCICLATLDHPYYTADLYGGCAHEPRDPHPPLLFSASRPEHVPGGGVLWMPDVVSPRDGFVYVTGVTIIWTLEHEQMGKVLRAKYALDTYRNARRRAVQARWNLRRAMRKAQQSLAEMEQA
jgi:hypothetical protein